jgi:AraC family transcriptional regulator, regulatory protein of adaptative response / methylated-DNA-[protein]-cysteine methyltransferase
MTATARQMNEAQPYATDAARWQAVASRDRRADGAFVYSCRTTGVYCRPSCASRLARRENVAFHANCENAELSGFRACKRCRPNETVVDGHAEAVAKACRLIEAAEELPRLEELAAAVGLSRFHFHRVFKAATGLTPKDDAAGRRARRVREELAGPGTVTEAIYGAGFNSSGRFYAASSSLLGMTPTRFRAHGAGASIRFAVGQCSLGAILVAATETGVCAIAIGDDPDALVRTLQDRFAKATLTGGDRDFEHWVAKVVGLVEAPRLGLDLPLDVRGTAFQQRVWQALREIPAGATATYSEIARRIGAPNAVRAVAHACAENPVAVAIPCHRVVRRDGDLAGYRWGIERKRALLAREALP